jgi:hypothetical protein
MLLLKDTATGIRPSFPVDTRVMARADDDYVLLKLFVRDRDRHRATARAHVIDQRTTASLMETET